MSAVLKAVAAVQRDIHAVGVDKLRRNKDQAFNFRGIDDAINAFAPLLTQHGLLVRPSYSDIVVTTRQTKSGGNTYNVVLQGAFEFVSVEDGSTHRVGPFYGEANDGQDKATSKATSVAYRNALFLTFCVPHEPAIGGDPDAHGEPDDAAADWLEVIRQAETIEQLEKSAAELKEQSATIPADSLKRIRAAWAARAKEVRK